MRLVGLGSPLLADEHTGDDDYRSNEAAHFNLSLEHDALAQGRTRQIRDNNKPFLAKRPERTLNVARLLRIAAATWLSNPQRRDFVTSIQRAHRG